MRSKAWRDRLAALVNKESRSRPLYDGAAGNATATVFILVDGRREMVITPHGSQELRVALTRDAAWELAQALIGDPPV